MAESETPAAPVAGQPVAKAAPASKKAAAALDDLLGAIDVASLDETREKIAAAFQGFLVEQAKLTEGHDQNDAHVQRLGHAARDLRRAGGCLTEALDVLQAFGSKFEHARQLHAKAVAEKKAKGEKK